MVELIAYTQDSDYDQVVLDLYGDEVIPLKYNIENIINPDKLNTNYSKQFDLPATKNNNRFFKAYYDVTTDGNFNPYKKVDVIVRIDSIEIFKGILQLYEISYKAGVSSYKVNVYSDIVNLFDEIKDKNLNDLDWDDLTHYYSLGNIADLADQLSIDNVDGDPIPAKVLVYPWCNWGMVTDGSTQALTAAGGTLDRPENMEDVFRPWVQLKYIWDKIWAGSSYNYTSTFLNADHFKALYMDNNWGDDKNRLRLDNNSGGTTYNTTKFWPNANLTPTTSYADLVFQNEDDDYDIYDPTTGYATAPTDNCKIYISGNHFRVKWYSANDQISIRIVHNSTHQLAPPNNQTWVFNAPSGSYPQESSVQIPWYTTVYLNAGESMHFEAKKSAATHADTKFIITQNGVGTQATVMYLELLSGHIMGIGSNFASNHGTIKQVDFLKTIIERFNLVIDVDKNDTKHVTIEPYSEWIDDGTTLDWSNKVDQEEYKIEVPDNYRLFTLSDTADTADLELSIFEDLNRRIYGTHQKNNTEIEMYDRYEYSFNKNIFSPTYFQPFSSAKYQDQSDPLAAYYPITVPIPYIYGQDLKKIKNKPRILYYSGIKDIDANGTSGFYGLDSYGFNNEADPSNPSAVGATALTNASGEIIKIPTASPYYDSTAALGTLEPDPADLDINYGVESWYKIIGVDTNNALTVNTVYTKYWHRYLTERYNKGVKVLKVNADLSAADVYNLSFNNKILIKGQAYYLLSVEHYPNTDKLTKLELLKITHDTSATCSVASIDPFTGVVLDSSGNSLTSYCCQMYGYNYSGGVCSSALPNNGGIGLTLGTGLNSNVGTPASGSGNNNFNNSGSNFLLGSNNNLQGASMNLVAGSGNNMSNAKLGAAVGNNHSISAKHASAFGMGGVATREGELVHSYTSTRGRAQQSTLIFTGTSSNADWTEIYIDGDSSKKFIVDQDGSDMVIGVEANVIAQDVGTSDTMHKYQHTTFKVDGSTGRPTQVGTTSTKTNNKDSGVNSWTNRFTVGTDYIKVEVQGEPDHDIEWTVILSINEMRL